MPVKPAAIYSVATDPNYSSGPAIGNPTKSATVSATEGFFPGTAIAAEEHNYLFNITGQWTAWLLAGTSLPVIDTTVVERDAFGRVELAILQLGNTAATLSPLIADSNPGQPAGDPTAIFSNSVGGACISATNNGAEPCVGATNSGDGPGVLGVSAGFNSAGVLGVSSAVNASVGVRGNAQNAAAIGVLGNGFVDAGSLPAVSGICNCDDGVGVFGQVATAAAGVLASAVTGDSTISPDATGVRGLSSGGYAVVCQADTSSPLRSSLRLVPQDDDPTIGLDGDEYHNSLGYRRIFADSLWRSVSTQAGNSVRQFVENAGPVPIPLAPTTVATASLGLNNQPLVVGDLEIMVEFDPAWGVSGAGVVQDLRATLRDTTAGVDVWTEIVALPDGLALVPVRSFTRTVSYTIPAAGARSFELIVERTGGGTDATVQNVVLKVTGVF